MLGRGNSARLNRGRAKLRRPRRILFLGDSITLGLWASDTTGFRQPLWEHCTSRGYSVDFVGTLSNGSTWSATRHEGNAGYSIADLRTKFEANYGVGKAIEDVDLAIVMIGTNDTGIGVPYAGVTTQQAYAFFIAKVAELLPNARLVVTTLPPLNGAVYPTEETNRLDFNAALPSIWTFYDFTLPKRPCIRWDASAALGGTWSGANFADDAHPNGTGFDLLSAALIAAVDPYMRTL